MQIVTYPGPALRRGGQKVERFDAELARTAREMFDTMYELGGVGLAAPQVGLDLSLLVLNPSGDRAQAEGELVIVNPQIVARKGSEFGEEGCLSFPGIYAEVERARSITVAYQDLDGQPQELRIADFLARIVQHEVDHLKGVLFVDRLSSVEKLRVRARLAEMERAFEAARA